VAKKRLVGRSGEKTRAMASDSGRKTMNAA
jgi:hypothetical protein